MPVPLTVDAFLSRYDPPVPAQAQLVRALLLAHLPGVTEAVDEPARMVAYSYGNRYIDLVCTILPSKRGLKLGFNRGVDLPDPAGLLQGTGKISRYVPLRSDAQLQDSALVELVVEALQAYRLRVATL